MMTHIQAGGPGFKMSQSRLNQDQLRTAVTSYNGGVEATDVFQKSFW